MNLIEKAKEKKNNKLKVGAPQEEVELAVAWLKGDVTIGQVGYALDLRSGVFPYSRLSYLIREAYRLGLIR